MVNTLNGEAFGFLGFDLRRVRKQSGDGHFILMTPKKKARKAVKAKVRDIVTVQVGAARRSGKASGQRLKHLRC
jgi:hypothetical protein